MTKQSTFVTIGLGMLVIVAIALFLHRGSNSDITSDTSLPLAAPYVASDNTDESAVAAPTPAPAQEVVPPSKPATPPPADKPAPSPVPPAPTPKPTPSPAPTTLPAEVNLAVPFISQAPAKNWDADHEEFCEEAALLMAQSYLSGVSSVSVNDAEASLQAIKTFEMKRFGYFKDTTAEETATILREYYHRSEVKVKSDPTVDEIKTALAAHKVVIVPAAGRQLGNPHFSGAGPLYHMVVLKGYTKDGKFITNDSGTQFGANYIYKIETIMNAMHDWNGGDVNNGKKVVIIVG